MGTRTGKRHPRRIDVTPTTYQLHLYRNSGMTALSCFGELIDNCIGAKARNIKIVIDGDARTMTVTDDGCGMHSAALAFQPGRHIEHGDEQGSPRYGVGLKDAGWRLGESIKIVTVRDGRKTVSVADTVAERLGIKPSVLKAGQELAKYSEEELAAAIAEFTAEKEEMTHDDIMKRLRRNRRQRQRKK